MVTNVTNALTGSVTFSLLKQGGEHHTVAAPALCSALEHKFLCFWRTVQHKCFQSNGVPQKRTVIPILFTREWPFNIRNDVFLSDFFSFQRRVVWIISLNVFPGRMYVIP